MNLHLFNAMLLVMVIGIFAKFAILIKKERNKKILEKINLWIDDFVGCRYRDSCETASVFRISVTPFSRSRKKSVPRSNIILCKKMMKTFQGKRDRDLGKCHWWLRLLFGWRVNKAIERVLRLVRVDIKNFSLS